MTRERSLRLPSPFSMAVGATILISATACVEGNVNALLLVLLRVPDLLIVLIWLTAAFGWGSFCLKASRFRQNIRWPLFAVTSIALGLGIESLATLGLGLMGWLNGVVAWAMLLVGAGIAVKNYASPSPGKPGEGGGEGEFKQGATFGVRNQPHSNPLPVYRERGSQSRFRWLWLLPVAVETVAVICALLPPGLLWGDEPNGYDVVEYHLQVPREWFEARKIIPLTHNVFSFFPFNVETHYLLAMHLRGGPWAGMYLAQLMHVAFIALSVLAVYALIAERSRSAAIVTASMVGCMPWVGLLAPVAYNEGGVLLWGTLAIGLLAINSRSVLLAGVMAGFACGAKLTAVPIVLIAAPLAGVIARQISWKSLLFFCIAGMAAFSPWLIRNWKWTGNPVFPEITSIFGRAHWDEMQVEAMAKSESRTAVGSAETSRVDSKVCAIRCSTIGDSIICRCRSRSWAALMTWHERRTRMLIALLLTLAVFWTFFTHLQSRFFVLAIPLAALIIGEAARPENQAL